MRSLLVLAAGLAALAPASASTCSQAGVSAAACTERPLSLPAFGYNFSLFAPPGSKPMPLVIMMSGYCLPADTQDSMQLSYLSKMAEWGFAYAPLKSHLTAPVCDLCPATIAAAQQAGDMPLYGPSARLLEPLTRAGLCTAWDATPACCQPKLGGANGGDVPLISAVIDASLAAMQNIDYSRVYIVGIANGGFMAQRVACEIGSRLAGVIAYASGLYASQCSRPEGAPSMMIMQGDVDVVVPYAGGENSVGQPFPGHVETVGIWKGMLGCADEPHTSSEFTTAKQGGLVPPPQLEVFTDSWSNCSSRGGVPRKLDAWRIHEGQHFAVPGTSADIFQRALAEMLTWR